MQSLPFRSFARGAVANTTDVKLRGTFLKGSKADLPTMIWLPELTEPAANFASFFDTPGSKVLKNRNVWLLDYRNQGESDHHASYAMDDLSDDIMRFMDQNKITMATIGGHGFGAKVAAATAINNMDRFTGVIQYEGGPINQKYHQAYRDLASYVQCANSIDLANLDQAEVFRRLDAGIKCKKWNAIFKANLNADGSSLSWENNMSALAADMKRHQPHTANWSESYGLWPGQALAIFAGNSEWIHLSTNTLPFYNVFPRLENKFPEQITTWANHVEGPMTHWLHEEPEADPSLLHSRMARWLRNQDGVHVLLADRSEIGGYWLSDRGQDPNAGAGGEYMPEHVHHNYKYSDVYEKSRERRGKEGALPGQFLKAGEWSM